MQSINRNLFIEDEAGCSDDGLSTSESQSQLSGDFIAPEGSVEEDPEIVEVVDLTQDEEIPVPEFVVNHAGSIADTGSVESVSTTVPASVPASGPRFRDYCFTLNNYTEEDEENLKLLNTTYVCYGREVGEQGTKHLQGYVRFVHPRTFSATKTALGPRYHVESRRGTVDQAIDYCMKDGDFVEYGVKPMSQEMKGKSSKAMWKEIIELSREGKMDEIMEKYPSAYVLHHEKLIRLDKRKFSAIDGELKNEWHYGPPGTGKSKSVYERFPNAYRKGLNKWWDSYEEEDEVIIEEWDPSCTGLSQMLKVWADRYPFRAEVKGASRMVRPSKIVITSNYSIKECCGDDVNLYEALKRRFKVIYHPVIRDGCVVPPVGFTVPSVEEAIPLVVPLPEP